MASAALRTESASIRIRLFDGTGEPFQPGKHDVLFTIHGGRRSFMQREMRRTGDLTFTELPLDGGADTSFAVVASTKGYHGAGYFPVKASAGKTVQIDLMMLPKRHQFNFHGAMWKDLEKNEPKLAEFFKNSVSSRSAAKKAYDELLENDSTALACFLNIWEIFRDIRLAVGNPQDYMHAAMGMDKENLCGDRFFAWCKRELIEQVDAATAEPARIFQPVFAPSAFHPGATVAYKEITYGQANLQICFHENDLHPTHPGDFVKTEFDVDYFKDPLTHFLLEVIPNNATGSITKPEWVYHLRWMASRRPGMSAFQPLYRILPA